MEKITSVIDTDVIETIPYEIWITDTDTNVICQNTVSKNVWGNMEGYPIDNKNLIHGISEKWRLMCESALAGKTIEEEWKVKQKSGTVFYLNIVKPIVKEERIHGVLGINIDISPVRQSEELLKTQRNLGAVLSSTSNLGKALDLILHISAKIDNIDCAAVVVKSKNQDDFNFLAKYGFEGNDISFNYGSFNSFAPLPSEQKGRNTFSRDRQVQIEKLKQKLRREEKVEHSIIIPLRLDLEEPLFFVAGTFSPAKIPHLINHVFEAIVIQIEEVLARIQAEEQLKQNERRYRIVSELTSDFAYAFRIESTGKIILDWITDAFRRITDYQFPQIQDMKDWISIIHKDDQEKYREVLNQRLEGIPQVGEYRIITADRIVRIVRDFAFPIWDSDLGKVVSILGAIRDITESKKYESELIAALEERDVMLKEIHHRVKNNLQIISSLLDLQANAINDAWLKEALNQSQNRVQSMARIHEQLYTSKDLVRIDMNSYIRKLLQDLMESYDQYDIICDVDIQTDLFNLDYAIPVGLLINELVSNSLKHAFPAEWRGRGQEDKKINISLRKSQGDYHLTVRDNGIGSPFGEKDDGNTLGFRLITMIIRQLEGTLETNYMDGMQNIIKFPLFQKKE